jgi:hypothetical protein
MLMGTSTHLAWAINNGFNSNNYNVPLFSRLFWDSLTFLDPIAALLLFLKPKIGICMVLIIILADVTHNNIIYFDELYLNTLDFTSWILKYWMIIGQIIFMLFVVFTFKRNLTDINIKLKRL